MSVSGIISTVKTRITASKPYLIGGVLGAIALLIIEFNAGWVVAAGTHTNELAEARLEAVATVCAMQASQHWIAEGNETAALEGWSNDKRDQLAEHFTPQIQNIRAAEITRLCGRMLKPA